METTSEKDPDLSVESRQGYFGANIGNNNAALLNNVYGNMNQGANNRYNNGQNNLASSWVNNGIGGNRYADQSFSKRRFANMGRFGNGVADADYTTGVGNGGGLTGVGDENGING